MWLYYNQVNTKHALELEGRCELRDFNWRLPELNVGRIGEMTGRAVFTTKLDNLSSTPGISHHEKRESAPDSCPDFHICATLNKHITNNCNLKLFNLVPAGSNVSSTLLAPGQPFFPMGSSGLSLHQTVNRLWASLWRWQCSIIFSPALVHVPSLMAGLQTCDFLEFFGSSDLSSLHLCHNGHLAGLKLILFFFHLYFTCYYFKCPIP